MKQLLSHPGFRAMGRSWAIFAACFVAGIAIVGGSHWYLEREKRETAGIDRRLADARTRVEAARRERDSLQQSADVFRTLVDRGLLQGESRLDLVETVNSLREKHHLFALDYEVAPQRPLPLSGGRVFTSVDVLASRVKLKARALHEGDLVAFIESLSETRQGFYPVDKCTLRRIENMDPNALQARVEADCTMEWITLKDKRAARPG